MNRKMIQYRIDPRTLEVVRLTKDVYRNVDRAIFGARNRRKSVRTGSG